MILPRTADVFWSSQAYRTGLWGEPRLEVGGDQVEEGGGVDVCNDEKKKTTLLPLLIWFIIYL